MLPGQSYILQEEHCPVPEQILGQLYRVSAHGLDELIATVPAQTLAMLALYCYRRTHLQPIGLAIAARCEKYDLEAFGGNAGKILFVSSRNAPHEAPASHFSDRRKVTLSTGALREFVQDEDDLSA
jgi:hypothetical protein